MKRIKNKGFSNVELLVISALIVICVGLIVVNLPTNSRVEQSSIPTSHGGMPKELKDCSSFIIWEGLDRYRVVRCPLSSVTVTSSNGKVSTSVTTIDENPSKP